MFIKYYRALVGGVVISISTLLARSVPHLQVAFTVIGRYLSRLLAVKDWDKLKDLQGLDLYHFMLLSIVFCRYA